MISEEMGLKLANAQVSQLGRARRVVVLKDTTTIIDGAGDPEEIGGRIKQIKAEVETTDSDFDRMPRSAWPSWPAGWPWSRWAPPPRPR